MLLYALLATPACAAPRDTGDSGVSARGAAAPAETSAGILTDPATWRVAANRIGPLLAGTRFADAAPLLGVSPSAGTSGEACTYVVPARGPAGVSIMVRAGEVARIQVDSGTVRTVEGAGIGDAESRVEALYPGRVVVGPSKYTNGHYLTVKPAAETESGFRLVFETDGHRVTGYRAGRLPEVEWVEGCG